MIETEKLNTNTENIDIISTNEMVEIFIQENKRVLEAIEPEKGNISKAIDLIAEKFLQKGKLFYFGAGTSGRLGVLDASECPPTFGVTNERVQGFIAGGDKALRTAIEGAEDNYAAGKADLKLSFASEKDVVVAISASGNPNYLLGVLETAKKAGISTIGITSNKQGEMLKFCDIKIIPEVGAEVIAGSTRMNSGTAQKIILNMLSTGAMVKVGKTYKNYMIDVRPTNIKLKNRAIRYVKEIAQTTEEIAKETLENNNWNVKISIIMLKKNVSSTEAKNLLRENKGILRKIIDV